MGNKNEKTFADLFSSSTANDETTTQTFSDILNNSIEEEKKSSSSVTFDSLFDKIPSKEIEPDKQADNPNLSEKELQKIETSPKENNNIFFNINQEEISSNQFNQESSLEKNNALKEQESSTIKFNPFFEEKEERKIEDKQITSESNYKTESKEKKKEINLKDNFFFQPVEEIEKTPTIPEAKKETIQTEPSNQTKTPIFDNNPFINDEVKPNQEENPTSEVVEINLPFQEKATNVEEKTPELNPFFLETSSSTNSEESSEDLIKEDTNNSDVAKTEDIKQPIEKEEKLAKKDLPKSTSPFFEEETKEEENPFFHNQLNLIENQIPNSPNGTIDIEKSKHYNVKIVKKKEPLIKFILGVISYALFIWLLLIGITLLIYVLDIKIRAAKGDYSTPTFNAYVVLTGSMLPEIEVYDVVVTKKVESEKLKEGDVITFASTDSRFLGTIITHRIIKKNPPTETEGYTFQTKGDNNNVADSALVPEKNIYGKVILKIPKLGYLQEFLASDGGWIIVILIPCLTVISYDIVKLIKGLKRKKYKNIKVQK